MFIKNASVLFLILMIASCTNLEKKGSTTEIGPYDYAIKNLEYSEEQAGKYAKAYDGAIREAKDYVIEMYDEDLYETYAHAYAYALTELNSPIEKARAYAYAWTTLNYNDEKARDYSEKYVKTEVKARSDLGYADGDALLYARSYVPTYLFLVEKELLYEEAERYADLYAHAYVYAKGELNHSEKDAQEYASVKTFSSE